MPMLILVTAIAAAIAVVFYFIYAAMRVVPKRQPDTDMEGKNDA